MDICLYSFWVRENRQVIVRQAGAERIEGGNLSISLPLSLASVAICCSTCSCAAEGERHSAFTACRRVTTEHNAYDDDDYDGDDDGVYSSNAR